MSSVLDTETVTAPPKQENLIQRLLHAEANHTLVQLFRYLIVGGVAFAADFGALFALAHFGHINYLWAAAFAFLVGIAVNYVMSRSWVFSKRTFSNTTLEVVVFCVIGLIGLGLNQVGMYVLTGMFGIHYLITKMINAGVVLAWNFGARKAILFR